MRVIEPYVAEVVFHVPEGSSSFEAWLERAGRTCYKSEDKITEESGPRFVRMLRERGHHAMLEHAAASARIMADRGLTHELVRHRLASFAQESTRYCNYSKGKFGSEITVIQQPGLDPDQQMVWEGAIEQAEKNYLCLLEMGVKPQVARSVLPIGILSEIIITANLREWRHIFSLRCDKPAHPIIRGIMLEILRQFYKRIPAMYEDLAEKFLPDVQRDTMQVRDGRTGELFEVPVGVHSQTETSPDGDAVVEEQ